MSILVLITSVIGWIITIGVAVYTVRSSSKDTDKKIAAIEESTKKQVESIKALQTQQIEASIKQVELEIEKNLLLAKQAKQEWEGIKDINNSSFAYHAQAKELAMQEFQEKKPQRDYNLYCKFIEELTSIKQGLMSYKRTIN